MTRCKLKYTIEVTIDRIVTQYSGLTANSDKLIEDIKKAVPALDNVRLISSHISVDEEPPKED